MAKYGSDDVAFILVDGYSIGGYLTDISDGKEAVVTESHCMGDSWVEKTFVGLKKAELSMGGFFDDTDNATNEAFVDQYAARTICYCVEGNTVGNAVTMLSGPMQSRYERIASREDLHRANITIEGSGEVEEGVIVATLTARTTAGDTESTPVDNAADTSDGGAVYLQIPVLTLGGYTNVIVKLRHSQDDVTYADKQAFTAVTAAPAKERFALTGDIYRYTAISWAWTGAGSDQTFTGMVGLHRN